MNVSQASAQQGGGRKRWKLVAVAAAGLFLLAFYTLTDPARLAGSDLLHGADLAGYAVCHRITERSFTIAGRQLPLCARCTGMYLGIALTFVVLFLSGRIHWRALPRLPILLGLLGLVGLMGFDGLNSYSHFFPSAPHLYEPQNWLRLVTGMGTGLAMGIFVFPSLAQTLWRSGPYEAVVRSWTEFLALLGLAGLVIFLVLSNQPAVLYVLGLVSAAAVVLILACLNTIFLLILVKRDGQAEQWRQVVAPLLAGLLLALVQIGAISYLRFSLTGTLTGLPGL